MSRRTWAGVALALAVTVVALVAHRRGGAPAAHPVAAAPAASAPGLTPRAGQRRATPVVPEVIEPVDVPQVDGATFAQAYADALCACTAPTCLDEVRERYARRTGEAQPSQDVRSVHEAFVRGQACIQTVRAAAADARG